MSNNALTVFRKELTKMTPEFERVLPMHLPAERLARTIESAVASLPSLLSADRASLWKSCMTAAVFGLEVDGRQAAIVPFKGKAQLIPMVSGLISLAHNAGFMIDAAVVREKDHFDYSRGLHAKLHHEPVRGGGRGNDNPVIAAYAIAWPIGHKADAIFEVLELPDIIARRDVSSGWRNAVSKGKEADNPWGRDFPAMARKSAIRALANHLPWQVQKAEELEGRHDRGEVTWATKDEDGGVTIDGEAEVINDG